MGCSGSKPEKDTSTGDVALSSTISPPGIVKIVKNGGKIGMSFDVSGNPPLPTVSNVSSDGAAAACGIKAGARISSISGESVAGKSKTEVLAMLTKDDSVELGIESIETSSGTEDSLDMLSTGASSAGAKISRLSSIAAVTPEFETVSFPGTYYGKVQTETAHGDTIIEGGIKRIKSTKPSKPTSSYLTVAAAGVSVKAADGSAILMECSVGAIGFCQTSKKDRKRFAFIHNDRALQMYFAHLFVLKQGNALDVTKAIKGAAVAVSRVASTEVKASAHAARLAKNESQGLGLSSNGPEKRPDASAVIGLFEMLYLGCVPVTGVKGQDVVVDAIPDLAKDQKAPEPVMVQVAVSGEGVRTVNPTTNRVLRSTVISSVSFTTKVNDKKALRPLKSMIGATAGVGEDTLFAYIWQDEKLHRSTCELYSCGPKADDVCRTINKAFKVALEVKEFRKDNPFLAYSQKREGVAGELFAKQIHRADMRPIKVVGMGQFGEVYLGMQTVRVRDPNVKGGKQIEIPRAVKIMRGNADSAARAEFLHEAEMMMELNHVNLVGMVGVAVQQKPWLTVIEYIKFGDLLAFSAVCAEKSFSVTYLETLTVAIQIAAGMEYIAAKGMIHMDLAARNVLLGVQTVAKIADFGLTRKVPEGKKYYRLMVTMKLPIKWMAYESMTEKIFSQGSDVWSYGVALWEFMAGGAIPYGELKNVDVLDSVKKGLRLEKPAACPTELHELLLTCWILDWTQVLQRLASVEAEKKGKRVRCLGMAVYRYSKAIGSGSTVVEALDIANKEDAKWSIIDDMAPKEMLEDQKRREAAQIQSGTSPKRPSASGAGAAAVKAAVASVKVETNSDASVTPSNEGGKDPFADGGANDYENLGRLQMIRLCRNKGISDDVISEASADKTDKTKLRALLYAADGRVPPAATTSSKADSSATALAEAKAQASVASSAETEAKDNTMATPSDEENTAVPEPAGMELSNLSEERGNNDSGSSADSDASDGSGSDFDF